MTNIFSEIDFLNGKLSNTEAVLILDIPLENQKDHLFHDILQVYYTIEESDYTIDVGWHDEDFEITENSYFWIQIIENKNWSYPLYTKKTIDLNEVMNAIETAVKFIENLDSN